VDVFVRHCSGVCMQGPVGLQGWLIVSVDLFGVGDLVGCVGCYALS
jgi:hypothetical protein